MLKKISIMLFSLFFVSFLSLPVFAADQSPSPAQPNTSGLFSSLSENDAGMQPIAPIDLNSLGNKAVEAGNSSYEFLLKGSIPLFVWAVGGSILIILLGIFFGKKIIIKGIVGVMIALGAVVLIHYLPQIALTVKTATGNAIAP